MIVPLVDERRKDAFSSPKTEIEMLIDSRICGAGVIAKKLRSYI